MPTAPLHKPAGVRCTYAHYGKGCSIYVGRPMACRTWFCRWLADPSTAGLPRPDRAHYVLDPTWDYVTVRPGGGGEPQRVSVVQVWVDPAFREAWRDPRLIAWIEMMADKHQAATIIRWNSRDALTVFAPSISSDRRWHEVTGSVEQRTPEEARILSLADRLDGSRMTGITDT